MKVIDKLSPINSSDRYKNSSYNFTYHKPFTPKNLKSSCQGFIQINFTSLPSHRIKIKKILVPTRCYDAFTKK